MRVWAVVLALAAIVGVFRLGLGLIATLLLSSGAGIALVSPERFNGIRRFASCLERRGLAAHDATDRIVCNKTTGALYFDEDGKGGAAPVEFAILATHPASLGFHDFVVIA